MLMQLLLLGLFLLISLGLYLYMMPLSFRPVARSGQHRLLQGSDCISCEEQRQEEDGDSLQG